MSIRKGTCPGIKTRLRVLAGLVCLILFTGPSFAEPIRFVIDRYEVVGNHLLEPADIEAMLKPWTGAEQDFASIQQALEQLEQAYAEAGYQAVAVLLPEQEIDQGVVRLRVIEPPLQEISVTGNRYFSRANLLAGFPGLTPGRTPNMHEISANLKLVNEHPAKKVKLLFNNSGDNQGLDAELQVTDRSPWIVELSADDTGTPGTDDYRAGVLLGNSNLFGRDHTLTLQYITSPQTPSDVAIFALGYRLPIYGWGDSIDLYAAYSDVTSGQIGVGGGNLEITGRGTGFGLGYNLNLRRHGGYQQRWRLGLDTRDFKDDSSFEETGVENDIRLHPVSLGYYGDWTGRASLLSGYLNVVQNIPGGPRGEQEDFDRVRQGSHAGYGLARGGLDGLAALPGTWLLRLRLRGQYSWQQLVPGEYFGIGGAESVRGFFERQFADDRGASGSLELETPNLLRLINLSSSRFSLLAFWDQGYTNRIDPLPGERTSTNIASYGGGARLNISEHVFGRVDYGRVQRGNDEVAKGEDRWHFRVVLKF